MVRARMRLLPLKTDENESYDDETRVESTPAKGKKEKKEKKGKEETNANNFAEAKILQGPEFQAVLPSLQSEPRESIEDQDEVMWQPCDTKDFVLDRFVRDTKLKFTRDFDKEDLPIIHRDCDLALFTLHQFEMDTIAARAFRYKTVAFNDRIEEVREAVRERKRKKEEKEEEERKREENSKMSRGARLEARRSAIASRIEGAQTAKEDDMRSELTDGEDGDGEDTMDEPAEEEIQVHEEMTDASTQTEKNEVLDSHMQTDQFEEEAAKEDSEHDEDEDAKDEEKKQEVSSPSNRQMRVCTSKVLDSLKGDEDVKEDDEEKEVTEEEEDRALRPLGNRGRKRPARRTSHGTLSKKRKEDEHALLVKDDAKIEETSSGNENDIPEKENTSSSFKKLMNSISTSLWWK